jgi:AmmeMemoRadiSam system protein B
MVVSIIVRSQGQPVNQPLNQPLVWQRVHDSMHRGRLRSIFRGARMIFDAKPRDPIQPAGSEIRPPAVAGLFYPESPQALASDLTHALSSVSLAGVPEGAGRLRAVVSPHAGYRYSGAVAAHAFATLAAQPDGEAPNQAPIVFLLGPNHRVQVDGFALPGAAWMRTPLGDAKVEAEIEASILERDDVHRDAWAHKSEHSLEVLVPFIQSIWGSDVRIVPVLVGRADAERVCELLEPYWQREDVRFVFSSDLSHFLDETSAKRRDSSTIEKLLQAQHPDLRSDEACGARALNGLTLLAQQTRMLVQQLDARTSADAGGDPRRVVGYASLAYWEPKGRAPS